MITFTINTKDGKKYTIQREMEEVTNINHTFGYYNDRSFITLRDENNNLALVRSDMIEVVTSDLNVDEYQKILDEKQQAYMAEMEAMKSAESKRPFAGNIGSALQAQMPMPAYNRI